MFEANAPSTIRMIDEMRIARVRQKIDELAVRTCGSEADADDLVANSIVLVGDPAKRPWDPAVGGLARHMGYVMHDVWIAHHRRAWTRREVVDTDGAHEAPSRHETPADEALIEAETRGRMKRLGLEVRATLVAEDPSGLKVFDAAGMGIEGLGELALAAGLTPKEVEKALRRIAYRAARIKERDDAELARGRKPSPRVDGRSRSGQDRQ
jgi:DNA-directed RNA polymerase specialized sigma24 family protein